MAPSPKQYIQPLLESDVLTACKHILDPLKAAGVLTYRRIYSGGIPLRYGKAWRLRPNTEQAGMADIEVYLPNARVLHVELKSSTGRLRPEQEAWRLELEALGHVFAVVRGPEELRQLLLAHSVSHWSLG